MVVLTDGSLTMLLPQILLVSFALLTPALDIVTVQRMKRIIAAWALTGLMATFILTLMMAGILNFVVDLGFQQQNSPVRILGGMAVIDSFYYFFTLVFLIVAIVVVIASAAYIKPEEPHQGEYYALLLLSTMGMTVVAMAGDFILLFVGLELSTLSTFALVSYRKRDRKSSEAGIKYFIIGGLSSALFLYGISLIFGVTGTTNFAEIHRILTLDTAFRPAVMLATVLVVAGLGFKMSTVPFHMWVPDTYQGAPTTITTFLAAGAKKMGFAAAFIVFLIALAAFQPVWVLLLGTLAVVTMTVGNVGALMQTSVKRLLAYSSIAQAGYIMIALAVATPASVAGGIYYVLAHALMKSGAFLVVAIVLSTGVGDSIEDYAGLRKRAPYLAFAMTVLLLSLAGFPPLGGFWGKFMVFASALDAGGNFMWLAVAGILNSALSVYYYFRVIKSMYVIPPKDETAPRVKLPRALAVALILTVVGTILIGLAADPIVDYATSAASALFQRV
ncbi:MAG: NADH-quinone oxidoreductase subunit N [Candidatus Bathyarchaeia archaeon]